MHKSNEFLLESNELSVQHGLWCSHCWLHHERWGGITDIFGRDSAGVGMSAASDPVVGIVSDTV